MSKPDLSISIQDYLKEIYKLQGSGQRATTTAIARAMGVAPSSATSMLKKLAALGLAEHAPYRGVELSEAGTKIALEVIRHHRLLEKYLAETLGLGMTISAYSLIRPMVQVRFDTPPEIANLVTLPCSSITASCQAAALFSTGGAFTTSARPE